METERGAIRHQQEHQGGGVAQLAERRIQNPKTLRIEPRQEHKNNLWVFFRVKSVVLYTHACVYRIRTHKNDHVRTLNPVVHVRVGWSTEIRKDPAACI